MNIKWRERKRDLQNALSTYLSTHLSVPVYIFWILSNIWNFWKMDDEKIIDFCKELQHYRRTNELCDANFVLRASHVYRWVSRLRANIKYFGSFIVCMPSIIKFTKYTNTHLWYIVGECAPAIHISHKFIRSLSLFACTRVFVWMCVLVCTSAAGFPFSDTHSISISRSSVVTMKSPCNIFGWSGDFRTVNRP